MLGCRRVVQLQYRVHLDPLIPINRRRALHPSPPWSLAGGIKPQPAWHRAQCRATTHGRHNRYTDTGRPWSNMDKASSHVRYVRRRAPLSLRQLSRRHHTGVQPRLQAAYAASKAIQARTERGCCTAFASALENLCALQVAPTQSSKSSVTGLVPKSLETYALVHTSRNLQ